LGRYSKADETVQRFSVLTGSSAIAFLPQSRRMPNMAGRQAEGGHQITAVKWQPAPPFCGGGPEKLKNDV